MSSLDHVKNLDHQTLLASGNLVYRQLVDELESLRYLLLCCTLRIVLAATALMHLRSIPTSPELETPSDVTFTCAVRRVKFFPDGRRLVYRVSGPITVILPSELISVISNLVLNDKENLNNDPDCTLVDSADVIGLARKAVKN